MLSQSKQISQLDKTLDLLQIISINISDEDRKAARNKLKLSHVTVWRYLNKKGTNLDLAIALLQFFKDKIAQREKEIVA